MKENGLLLNKYMTSISKNVYINKLDDIVNKYKNTIIHIIAQLK